MRKSAKGEMKTWRTEMEKIVTMRQRHGKQRSTTKTKTWNIFAKSSAKSQIKVIIESFFYERNEIEKVSYFNRKKEFLAKRKNSRGNKRGKFQDEFDIKEDKDEASQKNKKPRRTSNQEMEDQEPKEHVKFKSKSFTRSKQARFLGFSKNKIQNLSHKNKKSK
jgi:hypothetical protein